MHAGALRSIVDGKYEIDCALGRGGEGAVYKGRHRLTDAFVAIKLMLPDARQSAVACERFLHEARLASRVRNEHVVTVHDAGMDAVLGPYLVLELVEGENLDDRLARGRLTRTEAAACIQDVADGLDEIHHHRIVHRDLKPGNVIATTRRDGTCLFKLTDFGIAKELGKSRTTRSVSGTALYMAPEQCLGERPDVTVDVYALGLLAYEVLTGVAYWEEELALAKSDGELLALLSGGPKERASVRATRIGVALPPEFDAFFAVATARDPRQRFQRASDAAKAFSAAIGWIPAKLSGEPSAALSNTSPALPVAPTVQHRPSAPAPLASARAPAPDTLAPSNAAERRPPPGAQTLQSALWADSSSPRSRGAMIAGGILAFAVVAAGALLFTPASSNGSPTPAPPFTQPSPPPPAPPPAPAAVLPSATSSASAAPREVHIQVRIAVKPEGARILVDGAQVPSNPFVGRFLEDGAMHRIQIEASGFLPQSRLVAFDRDIELDVTLAPRPRPVVVEERPVRPGGPKPDPY